LQKGKRPIFLNWDFLMVKLPHKRLSIDQFWEENPLMTPCLKKIMPSNNMFSDSIISITCFLIFNLTIVLFAFYISENEFLIVFLFLLSCAFFAGGWWARWSIAVLKFNVAKRKVHESNG
jgi:hypothetical protein